MTSKADSLDKPRFLDGQEPPLTFTTPPANDARADRKVGFQHHHNLFVPSLSAMNSFSSHTLNSGTSFGSLDDLMDDQQLQGAAASMNILDPEYRTSFALVSWLLCADHIPLNSSHKRRAHFQRHIRRPPLGPIVASRTARAIHSRRLYTVEWPLFVHQSSNRRPWSDIRHSGHELL